MYQITVEHHFDAAHALRGYKGKCEALHGHRFRVVVRVKATGLDDIGLAYDFTELKGKLKAILDRFDHTCLNDVPPFDKINPSSENIASTIYGELKSELKEAPVELVCVEVWESPESGVEYREGE
jgi:6-pyruvoyltetrahydropterin/6-carboxytetrahydropterin synthase